jgi:cytochrome P450
MRGAPLPAVEPLPPRAGPRLPWVGAGLGLLLDPTGFFARARARLGESYLVDAFGWRLFCTFSPAGVRALYAFPEHEASFGLATFNLVFRHKAPIELVIGRRTRPHDLFGNQELEGYLAQLERAVARQMDELGAQGRFEAFALMRRLGHRLGLACWAGEEAATPPLLDRLIPLFDRLDTAEAFVRPASRFLTAATRQARERRALRGIEAALADLVRARAAPAGGAGGAGDFLDEIAAAWADVAPGEREIGIARDVIVIHLGAQSNLYAALAWTLVNLLLHPDALARVRSGDDAFLERCAYESIRLAQRSLTLRQVLRPVELDDGRTKYRLAPGVLVATMLSVTNPSAARGLERFDPDHYEGRSPARALALPARELVSTFGHGRHACPAQRFSISAIRIALRRLLERYELEPCFRAASPRRRQLGAVARSERACWVRYRRRSTPAEAVGTVRS